jgi:hypothetical protein
MGKTDRIEDDEDDDICFFCSELVSSAIRHLGILSHDICDGKY